MEDIAVGIAVYQQTVAHTQENGRLLRKREGKLLAVRPYDAVAGALAVRLGAENMSFSRPFLPFRSS